MEGWKDGRMEGRKDEHCELYIYDSHYFQAHDHVIGKIDTVPFNITSIMVMRERINAWLICCMFFRYCMYIQNFC